jgi:DNA-binding Lrp family transcriptional regulator
VAWPWVRGVLEMRPRWKATEFAVLIAIANQANDSTGIADEYYAAYAQRCGASERTIVRSLDKLEAKGIIARQKAVVTGRGTKQQIKLVGVTPLRREKGDKLSSFNGKGDRLSPFQADEELSDGERRVTNSTRNGDKSDRETVTDWRTDPKYVPVPDRTAASPRNPACEPNGDNYRVIAKLAREQLRRRPDLAADESELIAATKQACADHSVDYGRHPSVDCDVVHRACSSELVKFRLGLNGKEGSR